MIIRGHLIPMIPRILIRRILIQRLLLRRIRVRRLLLLLPLPLRWCILSLITRVILRVGIILRWRGMHVAGRGIIKRVIRRLPARAHRRPRARSRHAIPATGALDHLVPARAREDEGEDGKDEAEGDQGGADDVDDRALLGRCCLWRAGGFEDLPVSRVDAV